jgi:hypothetical protein
VPDWLDDKLMKDEAMAAAPSYHGVNGTAAPSLTAFDVRQGN